MIGILMEIKLHIDFVTQEQLQLMGFKSNAYDILKNIDMKNKDSTNGWKFNCSSKLKTIFTAILKELLKKVNLY